MSGLSDADTGDCDHYGAGVRGIDDVVSSPALHPTATTPQKPQRTGLLSTSAPLQAVTSKAIDVTSRTIAALAEFTEVVGAGWCLKRSAKLSWMTACS